MIMMNHVSAGYGNRIVIEDITISLEHPFFAVIAGPNGAGKSTMLKVLLGIVKRKSGSVSVFGIDPEVDKKSIRRIVSYMPQSSTINLDIPLRVKEVVAMPLRIMGEDDESLVREALEIVGAEKYENEIFSRLSGGLRQRVLLARALVKNAKLILLDEPLSHIDSKGRGEIFSTLHRIHEEKGVSFLIVGHDLSVCALYDPYLILLNRRIVAHGRFSEIVKPKYLAEAYGSILLGEGFVVMGEEHG
ncbi:zinc ABC transporter ATPase [Desulfurococcaceae archaeon AG1]|jgi:ABC-type Mn2+/Zn2+ transport system ATPase subunit|nr:MAG: metal ABC transporter ATP-binding protein [Desulfurococcaceae archaeon]GAY26500.1 zinc ABC transporter ATPase [Desulfurococcaceae archaeon AG1]